MSAIFSRCGNYRYELRRTLIHCADDAQGRPLVFCMVNPSTADATIDDPTIRRCCGFARRGGWSELIVVNLYALRSRDPAALWGHADPVGPDNAAYLRCAALAGAGQVVVAWGTQANPQWASQVASLFLVHGKAQLYCLGTTKNGSPRRPLYVPADQPLLPWHGYKEGE
jgi:hypothetical protein